MMLLEAIVMVLLLTRGHDTIHGRLFMCLGAVIDICFSLGEFARNVLSQEGRCQGSARSGRAY
jgi:hypothetical protein